MKKIILLITSLVVLFASSSCDTRRTIHPEGGVWVVVNFDWSELSTQPNGATLVFYPQTRTELFTPTIFCTNYVKDSLYLPKDEYLVTVINETVDSHSNMTFSQIYDYQLFEANIVEEAITLPDDSDKVIGLEPDILTIDHGEFEITRQSVIDSERRELFFTPSQVTSNLQVTLHIEGIDNLSSYTQYLVIEDMSSGVYLKSGESNDDSIAQRVIFTEKTLDGSVTTGYIRGNVNCFGVVEDPLNTVNIYLHLRDGTDYGPLTYDATDLIYVDENNKLQLYLDIYGIELPEVNDIYNPTSGFDAEVGEWEDEETVLIPVS